ncbi:IclR family transcriptional regulator [Desulfoscipio sp. XC116]|uniref:IclR family transcriptional regulator n=1 Tax=Desulfoscipio sp. XC116 TaxID=3144975 RepID=UPI00325BD288
MTKQNNNGDDTKTVQAVERALFILETLAEAGAPITITELAQKTNLTLGTAHRLLYTMMQRGFVEQNSDNSKYRLGIKAFQIGSAAAYFKDLHSVARPIMEDLQQRYNETVNLATLDGSEVVYVDQVESTNIVVVRMFARTGNRGPAHCTGSGKVLLSSLPQDQLKDIVYNMHLEKFSNETITEPEMLMKELNRVRLDGYALDLGERDEGVRCVAAPIKNMEGRVVAALSISGPSIRITTPFIKNELVDAVGDAAKSISIQLGYKGE